MTPELQTIAQYSTLRIVDSLAEGTLVAAFAAIMYRLARRQSAGMRFAIWFSALIAIAALPLVGSLSLQSSGPGVIHRAALIVPDSWALYVFVAWALISGYFLLRVARAVWHLHALRKECTPLRQSELPEVLQESLRRTKLSRKVEICTSQQVRVPTALGLVQPAIVIPEWAMRELSPTDLNQILLHELAHLYRWDDWTNLAQQLVRALFFFHPAVWWIENKAALEREIACDDAVVAETASPRAYAECLAHLAERSFVQRSLALAQAAVGKLRQTTSRVAEILDVNRPRANPRGWKPAVSLVIGFAIACGVFAERAPRLIAFGNSAHETHALKSPSDPSQEQIPAISSAQQSSEDPQIIQAKYVSTPASAHTMLHKQPAPAHRVILRPKAGRMVHLAKIDVAPVPVAETLIVFFQSAAPNTLAQAGYEFQVLRLTFVRYVADPVTDKTPAKKI